MVSYGLEMGKAKWKGLGVVARVISRSSQDRQQIADPTHLLTHLLTPWGGGAQLILLRFAFLLLRDVTMSESQQCTLQ